MSTPTPSRKTYQNFSHSALTMGRGQRVTWITAVMVSLSLAAG